MSLGFYSGRLLFAKRGARSVVDKEVRIPFGGIGLGLKTRT